MTASSQTLDSKITASQTGASSLLNCSSQNRLTLNRSIGCLSNPKELQKLTQKFLHSKKVTNPKVLASAALGESQTSLRCFGLHRGLKDFLEHNETYLKQLPCQIFDPLYKFYKVHSPFKQQVSFTCCGCWNHCFETWSMQT
ncbi:hypothetical protein P8452_51270 [Trifolium repens]|nr:hypothetical protein P8452_51270 [Trifolium repens]